MNNQHANTEAARRLVAIRENLGGDDQVVHEDAIQEHATTAQDARQRIRDAAVGDVVPLDTFPARATSPVNTLVQAYPRRASVKDTYPGAFVERTFERTDAGWKRVK